MPQRVVRSRPARRVSPLHPQVPEVSDAHGGARLSASGGSSNVPDPTDRARHLWGELVLKIARLRAQEEV
jgi:hypothetical protein